MSVIVVFLRPLGLRLDPGTWLKSSIGNPKGGQMMMMKKPIRLLGMVFQID